METSIIQIAFKYMVHGLCKLSSRVLDIAVIPVNLSLTYGPGVLR